MDRERYLETLKNHYADGIKEAYFECEHRLGDQIDVEGLNERLSSLATHATVQGLPVQEFDELVRCVLPSVHSLLDYLPRKRAA